MRGRIVLSAALWTAALVAACGSGGSAVIDGDVPHVPAESLLAVSLTPDESVIADDDGDSVVMIEVAATPRPVGPRPPVAMAIVVDASGSMEGPSWEQAERAAHALVDELSPGDGLVIVAYADSAALYFQSFDLDEEAREQAHEELDTMEPVGNTCVSCGLEMGYSALQNAYPGQLRRLVLMSDGRANRGLTDEDSLVGMTANAHLYWQIDTSTIGLGRLHDAPLMASLAESGSSSYYYLSDASQLSDVLERELSDLETTVLTGLVLSLVPGDGVTISGTPNSGAYPSGNDLVFELGQLALGEQRQLVVELTLPPGDVGRLLTAQVSFADPTGYPYQLEAVARVRRSSDAAEIERSREPRVLEQLSLMQSVSNARRALRAIQTDEAEDGVGILFDAAARLREQAITYQSDMLAREAVRFESLAETVEDESAAHPQDPPPAAARDFARSEELLRGVPVTDAYHE